MNLNYKVEIIYILWLIEEISWSNFQVWIEVFWFFWTFNIWMKVKVIVLAFTRSRDFLFDFYSFLKVFHAILCAEKKWLSIFLKYTNSEKDCFLEVNYHYFMKTDHHIRIILSKLIPQSTFLLFSWVKIALIVP